MVDTSKYSIDNVPESLIRKYIEEEYLNSYLKYSPTFFLYKMTYEPYSVLPLRKDTMDYLMRKDGALPSEFREFKYKYKAPEPVQLELFNF